MSEADAEAREVLASGSRSGWLLVLILGGVFSLGVLGTLAALVPAVNESAAPSPCEQARPMLDTLATLSLTGPLSPVGARRVRSASAPLADAASGASGDVRLTLRTLSERTATARAGRIWDEYASVQDVATVCGW